MDNPFLENPHLFPLRHPATRRSRVPRASRIVAAGLFLLAIAPSGFPQTQASIAPDGEFLPNDPYILPTPPDP